jgi:hypothetical protein
MRWAPLLGRWHNVRILLCYVNAFLPEEAMQTIITGKLPENSKSASALAVVERIEANLEASSIVLFMKGSPDFPQCGFSARVVSALRECRAAFTGPHLTGPSSFVLDYSDVGVD